MARHLEVNAPERPRSDQPAHSRVRMVWGKASFEAEANITPLALLAVGGMVGMILLALAPVVRATDRPRRRF